MWNMNDHWSTGTMAGDQLPLPPFKRSVVVRFDVHPGG
jgi:hypothetical protein